MSNYCVFNDNGIKNIEQIIFWRQVEKDPPTISFMTPSGIYLYVQNLIDDDIKPLGVINRIQRATHEFYKYCGSSAWPVPVDTGDHKKWKIVSNIESINFHY